MITRMRRVPVSIAVLLLAGALGACGHSGSTSAAGAATTSSGASTAPAAPGRDATGFCAVVKQQKALLQGTELSSLLAGGSPDAWKAYLAKVATMNQQLDDAAPADIKPSVDALLTATADMRAALEAAGYDVRKVGASKLVSLLNTPARKDASAKLTAYVQTNCGIDLSQP